MDKLQISDEVRRRLGGAGVRRAEVAFRTADVSCRRCGATIPPNARAAVVVLDDEREVLIQFAHVRCEQSRVVRVAGGSIRPSVEHRVSDAYVTPTMRSGRPNPTLLVSMDVEWVGVLEGEPVEPILGAMVDAGWRYVGQRWFGDDLPEVGEGWSVHIESEAGLVRIDDPLAEGPLYEGDLTHYEGLVARAVESGLIGVLFTTARIPDEPRSIVSALDALATEGRLVGAALPVAVAGPHN